MIDEEEEVYLSTVVSQAKREEENCGFY